MDHYGKYALTPDTYRLRLAGDTEAITAPVSS